MRKYKIIRNKNKQVYETITQNVKDNDGFCPCRLERNHDTRCICKEFKERNYGGECHCGRFIKVIDLE